MSVQSEINRLTAARDALAAWLTEKGVTVPEDATLETLVVLAAQITNGVQTVNGVEPDENGNVDVDVESDVFIATYGTTTSAEIEEAYQAGKVVLCKGSTTNVGILITRILETVHQFLFAGVGIVATCNNNEWSETAFTAAPATHASTHATGGTDPIAPDDIGAAAPPVYRTITLSASSWDSTALTQTVTVSGILADETKQLIQVMPATSNNNEYFEAGVLATAQGTDSLTFTCGVVPTVDLSVFVTITEVSA